MGCRCSDIARLEGQINKLKQSLSCAQKANSSKVNTLECVKKSANAYETGVVFAGAEVNTASEIKNSYNKASGSIGSACTAISTAISKAQSKMSSYKSEDKSYHDSKKKKKHKHN